MRDVETDRLPLSKLARVVRRASTLSTGRSLPLNRRKARASPRRLDQSQAPAPPVPLAALRGQEIPSVAETRAEVRRRTCANFERRRRDTSALDVQLSHASRMRGGRGDVWATTAIAAPRVCARGTRRSRRHHKIRHDAVRAPRGLVVVSSPSFIVALLRAAASRSLCSAAPIVTTHSQHKHYCSRASR